MLNGWTILLMPIPWTKMKNSGKTSSKKRDALSRLARRFRKTSLA
jgi:hypothetical protein